MARKKPTTTDLTAQSVALAEFAAKALIAAEQLGIKKTPIRDFPFDDTESAIMQWSGDFDAEALYVERTTKAMQRGLPDRRQFA